MALSRAEVRRIATLARLDLTPAEEELFVDQLGKIVDYFDQLRGFEDAGAGDDAADPDVDSRAAAGQRVLRALLRAERPDKRFARRVLRDLASIWATHGLPRDAFLGNAPESIDGFLVVPQVKAKPG